MQDVEFLEAVTGENDGTVMSEVFSCFCLWGSPFKNLNMKYKARKHLKIKVFTPLLAYCFGGSVLKSLS